MDRGVWTCCAVVAIALFGCGPADKTERAATGAASAEQVATAARGNVTCPARASIERPASSPVDDVVGVRPGMTWDEAANFVMCDNPLLIVTENTSRTFNIKTFGVHIRQSFDGIFAEPRVVKTSKEIVKEMQDASLGRGLNENVALVKPGQARYLVSTMGLPGQERVLSVSRYQYFAEGKLPTVDSIRQALITKYGLPSYSEMGNNGNASELGWEYDRDGRKITETSPLLRTCRNEASPIYGVSFSPNCGVTVGAEIQLAKENSGLAESLAVASQNGAEGFARLNDTEQALLKVDQTRQVGELRRASKGTNGPKL